MLTFKSLLRHSHWSVQKTMLENSFRILLSLSREIQTILELMIPPLTLIDIIHGSVVGYRLISLKQHNGMKYLYTNGSGNHHDLKSSWRWDTSEKMSSRARQFWGFELFCSSCIQNSIEVVGGFLGPSHPPWNDTALSLCLKSMKIRGGASLALSAVWRLLSILLAGEHSANKYELISKPKIVIIFGGLRKMFMCLHSPLLGSICFVCLISKVMKNLFFLMCSTRVSS